MFYKRTSATRATRSARFAIVPGRIHNVPATRWYGWPSTIRRAIFRVYRRTFVGSTAAVVGDRRSATGQGCAHRIPGFAGVFKAARSERVGAIHVLPSPNLRARRTRLIELALRYRLPAFYGLATYVEDGKLMPWGPGSADLYGRTASHVDRVLNGAHPGDLAIEQPSRFLLVINQRTAAAIGLSIPESLLRQADRLIQ